MVSKPTLFRLKRELDMISTSPSPGINAWVRGDDITQIDALIVGPDDSPYEKGMYSLSNYRKFYLYIQHTIK